ncbi:MAG: prolipoprotein diacylglyceryl transferase [Acidobacteria bacterium]|nr:prolipoprotein diacylglyceryl transferase [Acidobacteriota bacterium]
MLGPYTHRIDPILFDVGGVHLWWYGLGFALGFLELHLFLRRGHGELRLSPREVWSLSLFVAVGVLVGGRAIEIAFDEWPFYREHLHMIPAWWLGGMATHGLLLGGGLGAAVFAHRSGKPFLLVADVLVIPAAFLLGMGRIGNFIDGHIVGAATDVWWAVKFPDAEGFRHPVVLYDGAKNLLLMAYLLHVRRVSRTPGAVAARFVFWYAFPRFFIDLFRDYPTHRLALGTGQTLNIVMAAVGAGALYRSRMRRLGRLQGTAGWGLAGRTSSERFKEAPPLAAQRLAFAGLLAFCLTIPSNWTQDVPARYGARHPGLEHSWLYPEIDSAPPQAHPRRLTVAPEHGRGGHAFDTTTPHSTAERRK